MEVKTDKGYQITARRLMHDILYDNDGVNRLEPDNESRYPKNHFDAITSACELFFGTNPAVLTDGDLEDIANGCQDYNIERYGDLIGYRELNEALGRWFYDGI